MALRYNRKLNIIKRLAKGKRCLVNLDEESAIVYFTSSEIRVLPDKSNAKGKKTETSDIQVSLSKRVVSDLLDGRLTVLGGIEDSMIEVFGDIQSLETFYKVLEVVLSIAPSSPEMIQLFSRFKKRDKSQRDLRTHEKIIHRL
jgi:hypothetical protein